MSNDQQPKNPKMRVVWIKMEILVRPEDKRPGSAIASDAAAAVEGHTYLIVRNAYEPARP